MDGTDFPSKQTRCAAYESVHRPTDTPRGVRSVADIDPCPGEVGIEAGHATDDFRGVAAEILLEHGAVLVDQKSHKAGASVNRGPSHEGEALGHASVVHIVLRPAGRVRPLRLQHVIEIALIRRRFAMRSG